MTDLGLILVIVLVVLLLVRGPKVLPRLGEAAGQAIRGARRAVDGEDQDAGEPRDRDRTGEPG